MKRGDRYLWRAVPEGLPVFGRVIRVARDQSWADFRFNATHRIWSKRMPLPLPPSFEKET